MTRTETLCVWSASGFAVKRGGRLVSFYPYSDYNHSQTETHRAATEEAYELRAEVVNYTERR